MPAVPRPDRSSRNGGGLRESGMKAWLSPLAAAAGESATLDTPGERE